MPLQLHLQGDAWAARPLGSNGAYRICDALNLGFPAHNRSMQQDSLRARIRSTFPHVESLRLLSLEMATASKLESYCLKG